MPDAVRSRRATAQTWERNRLRVSTTRESISQRVLRNCRDGYNAAVSTPDSAVSLDRALGPLDAAALVVSNIIGIGIFTAPGIVAQMVPQPLAMLGVWLAGGVLAFAGATAYAQLAWLWPRAGGEYVYLREAFGPPLAFLTAWTSFVAGFSGAVAAGAVGLTEYIGRYVPAVADTHPLVAIPLYFTVLTVSTQKLAALVILSGLSAIHIRGLGPGKRVQNALTALTVLALTLLIVFGFTGGAGSVEHFHRTAENVRPLNWLLALVPVLFTYSGWNAAAYVAEEVREPLRNVPRALTLGTACVVALYLVLNLLYLYALPVSQLAGVIRAGDAAAEALFGSRGAGALTLVLIVSLASSISAMILAGPRVYFAAARDGLFLRSAARIHPRYRTPAVAILAQAIWSGLLVISGTFEQLLVYTGFAVILFAGLAVAALFVLRRGRNSSMPGWGYPVAPALFVLASLAIVANAIRERPLPSVAGLLVIGAGVPVYFLFRRKVER